MSTDHLQLHPRLATAAPVACLTIYDVCRAAARSMVIGDIALWEKAGGRSGTFRRQPSLEADDPSAIAFDHI